MTNSKAEPLLRTVRHKKKRLLHGEAIALSYTPDEGRRFSQSSVFGLLGLLDLHGLLADPATKVVQLRTPDFALLNDFNFSDLGGMNRENTFHAFAIGDFANCKGLVDTNAVPGKNDPLIDLNTFFAAFNDPRMDFDGVSGTEIRHIALQLFALDFVDDVHGSVLEMGDGRPWGLRFASCRQGRLPRRRPSPVHPTGAAEGWNLYSRIIQKQ